MIDTNDEPGSGTAGLQKNIASKSEVADAQPIKAKDEKSYYAKLKKKNKNYLVPVDAIERERIAEYIIGLYNKADKKHKELCDNLTEYDEIYRMERKQVVGDDGDMPNYRTPLSTVAVDVIHSNYMNVFFSPKDPIRALPTEPNDAPKISKLTIFVNWSTKNELEIFEATDRLWHNSTKNGECPYILDWVKEYGVDIKREVKMNPEQPDEPLYDDDTGEVVYDEIEQPKLLYNGPRLEIISRKDYIQPDNAIMGDLPEWEMIIRRYSYDDVWKEMMSGKMYDGCLEEIKGWGQSDQSENEQADYEGDSIPVGDWEKECVLFFGRMRVNVLVKKLMGNIQEEDIDELEDEFIGLVHIKSRTLLSLRKNKFPLKMRPVDVDYFMPDDEGRRAGIGVIKFMDSLQKAYDAFFNQFCLGVMNSNNPIGFFTPTGNMRNTPMKIRNGYMYPTADASSIHFERWPMPDESIKMMMELIQQWAQLLFGISDYTAGVESTIDPQAPAKKAQIVVEQGNVRLNMILKRKNQTLRNICRRWYLLYRDNMPKDKFMRIVGDDENNQWKFEPIRIEDFQLKSLPDFELTGNVLSANKQLQANAALAIYQVLVANPFFNPTQIKGLQALHSLTKWVIDKLDDTGLSRFLPKMPGDDIMTPEEENARFLQGDDGDPAEGEDHMDHLKKHTIFLHDPLTPPEIKPTVAKHIAKTIEMIRQMITQQTIMQQMGAQAPMGGPPAPPPGGMLNGNPSAGPTPPTGAPRVFPKQIPSAGSAPSGVPGMS